MARASAAARTPGSFSRPAALPRHPGEPPSVRQGGHRAAPGDQLPGRRRLPLLLGAAECPGGHHPHTGALPDAGRRGRRPVLRAAGLCRRVLRGGGAVQQGADRDPCYATFLGAYSVNMLYPTGSRSLKRQYDGSGARGAGAPLAAARHPAQQHPPAAGHARQHHRRGRRGGGEGPRAVPCSTAKARASAGWSPWSSTPSSSPTSTW